MRTISSTASSATIIALRVAQVSKNSISETASSVADQPLAQPVHHLRDGDAVVAQLELRTLPCGARAPAETSFTRSTSETTSSPSISSPAYSERSGLRPHVLFDLLLLVEKLRGVLEFFVFDQAMHQLVARVLLLFGAGQRVGRQQHFRLDVDQRRGHVDEVGRDVDIELFELVEVVEILLGDFGDGNIVDVHLLLADQIEQEIERAFVDRQIDSIG